MPKLCNQIGRPYTEKIAVIGAGPAGMSCAYYLANKGYPVTVFDRNPVPGGMLTLGIPNFRLEKDVLNAEIDILREMGVEFRCGVEVGKDITIDELRKRGFGEALYSQLTPEQRQQTLILRDADELGELITNREEAMAAETMLTNGCVMKHIADDVDKADEMEIRFYSEASNPATYTPTAKWDATGGKILKDLEAMIRMLTKRGLRASDLVCSPDVADTIINDAAVQKLLDNRRIEIGNAEPELLPDGAAIVARLNVLGRIISVISYDLTYTDDEGDDKLYIPSGKCVLTAPGAGRTAYGAVSQVEQSDGEFHTYAGRRVPKYVSSAEGNSRTLTISSRPLLIPNNKNPWIVADVLTSD